MDMEYNELWDIYDHIDVDANVEQIDHSRYGILIHPSLGKLTALALVEVFVRDCLRTVNLAYDMRIESAAYGAVMLPMLAKYYSSMDRMLDAYDARYYYSPRVDVFYNACKQIELLPKVWDFRENICEIDPERCVTYGDSFNSLIMAIRELGAGREFRDRLLEQQRDVEHRVKQVLEWEQALFEGHKRYLILPLTLGYKAKYRDQITPERLQHDLNRLVNNRRSNRRLKKILEFVWRREEGDQTGLHAHFLVAYDGKARSGMKIAKFICKYWVRQITEGMGEARSGNWYQGSSQVGIYDGCAGQVNWYDTWMRKKLREALIYMAKASQLMKCKTSSKYHSIGMSHPETRAGKIVLAAA